MKGEIAFHLGLHKTATTALQMHLFPKLSGVHYLGRQFPADTSRPIDRVIDALACTDPVYFDAAKVRDLLDSCCVDAELNLVSHELLSGPLWTGLGQRGLDNRSAIIRNLAACRPDARILLVLRRQDAWAQSVYRQYVVAGGVERPSTLFQGARPLFSPNRFLYTAYVRALRAAFPERVTVLFYEELQQDRAAFFRSLAAVLGSEIREAELPLRNSSDVGPWGIALSRQLNRYFRGRINSAAPLPGIPRRAGGRWTQESAVALLHKLWPKLQIGGAKGATAKVSAGDAQVFSAVHARCHDDNRALAELLDVDLKRYGYY